MALSFSNFPFCPSKTTTTTASFPIAPKPTRRPTIFSSKPLKFVKIAKASQDEDSKNAAATSSEKLNQPEKSEKEVEISEVGAEIKKAMKERGESGGKADFLSGVAEEIREIEWPSFGRVVGTTGVVLGVIAGSSVVLLTVNAVLAELSDRVFAGKGFRISLGRER